MSYVNEIADDWADWLLDAVAMASQNRTFLRGDECYDEVIGQAILLNGRRAILSAIYQIERVRTGTVL